MTYYIERIHYLAQWVEIDPCQFQNSREGGFYKFVELEGRYTCKGSGNQSGFGLNQSKTGSQNYRIIIQPKLSLKYGDKIHFHTFKFSERLISYKLLLRNILKDMFDQNERQNQKE